MFSSFPYFALKLLFPCHSVVSMTSCILSLLASRIFSLFCLYCFILFLYLYSLPTFASTFWFIFLCCIVLLGLLFSLHPNMFLCSLSVLSFLLVVVNFLSAFPVEFPIQILSVLIFIIIILLLWEFFTLALTDGFSLEFEWQKVSSSLQNSQYSVHSQKFSSLDGLHSSSYFQVLHSLYQIFVKFTENSNYNWYHCHFHIQ